MHVWLADENVLAAGQGLTASSPLVCPAALLLCDSSNSGKASIGKAAGISSNSGDSGRTVPVEAAQPTKQWLNSQPADKQHSSPTLGEVRKSDPHCEGKERNKPPAVQQPAMGPGPEAVQLPAAATGLCSAAAAGPAAAIDDETLALQLVATPVAEPEGHAGISSNSGSTEGSDADRGSGESGGGRDLPASAAQFAAVSGLDRLPVSQCRSPATGSPEPSDDRRKRSELPAAEQAPAGAAAAQPPVAARGVTCSGRSAAASMSAIIGPQGFLKLGAAIVHALLPATTVWPQLPPHVPIVLVIGPPGEVRCPRIVATLIESMQGILRLHMSKHCF